MKLSQLWILRIKLAIVTEAGQGIGLEICKTNWWPKGPMLFLNDLMPLDKRMLWQGMKGEKGNVLRLRSIQVRCRLYSKW